MIRLATSGLAITGLALFALAQLWPWQHAVGSAEVVPPLVVLLAFTELVYFVAVRLVLRHASPRHAIWIVPMVAAAIRLPLLSMPPILSSDIYRCIWDGRVQLPGINPCLYVPADPALANFRDAEVYPHINRATYAHTIYPSMARLVFAATARVAQSVLAEKAFMPGFEAVAILCALRLPTPGTASPV